MVVDDGTQFVARFLEAVDAAGLRLNDSLGAELRSRGLTALVRTYFQSSNLSEGKRPAVGICLSASRSPQHIFEFWVDVLLLTAGWLVRAEVYADAAHGQTRIQNFPERRASTLDECLEHLQEAVADLATGGHLVFENPTQE